MTNTRHLPLLLCAGLALLWNPRLQAQVDRPPGLLNDLVDAAQGQATGRQQPGTPRCAQNRESRLICPLCQILAQSEISEFQMAPLQMDRQ